jgi:hypothetical protein
MDNKNSKHTRHFQFAHPTFGTEKNPKPALAWERSIYYWWFEHLKRNTSYHELIDTGSNSQICLDFGDVRSKTFKDWWKENDRAVFLFAEPLAKVVRLEDGQIVDNDQAILTLSFPLTLPKDHLRKRFESYLKKYHTGKSGVQNSKFSQARYQFSGQPQIEAYKRGIEVYDLHIASPNVSLYELCKGLKWIDYPKVNSNKLLNNDLGDKKAMLNSMLKRHLKRTQTAIEATTYGCFPKINSID